MATNAVMECGYLSEVNDYYTKHPQLIIDPTGEKKESEAAESP